MLKLGRWVKNTHLIKEANKMRFYIYKDDSGYWRWYLEAANHKKIAVSGESYENKSDCEHAIDLIKSTNQFIEILYIDK
jgi:uncharacterized protein YegP (UPF0339 family)